MTQQSSDGSGQPERQSLADLIASIEQGTNIDQQIIRRTVQSAGARNKELAALIEACAIPRRIDSGVIGALRDDQTHVERNDELFEAIGRYSFVIERPDGSSVYHDTTRDALLADWRSDPAKAELFATLNTRLVRYFEQLYREARRLEEHLARVSELLKQYSTSRHLQVASAVETRVTTPLTEALFHAAMQSTNAVCDFLIGRYEENDEDGRLTLWLLRQTNDVVQPLRGDDRRAPRVLWLRYWQARALGGLGRLADAERILRELLDDLHDDVKLKLWVLGLLGGMLDDQSRLREAREMYEQAMSLANESREDVYNLPVTYSQMGRLYATLDEFEQAITVYRQAIASPEPGTRHNFRAEVIVRMNLVDAYRNIGRWQNALDEALVALHLARTELRDSQEYNYWVARSCMTLIGSRDGRLLDTMFWEASALRAGTANWRSALSVQYAWALLQAGRLESAEQELKRMIGDKAEDPSQHVQVRLAQLRHAQGLHEQAIEIYDGVLAAGPDAWTRAGVLANRGQLFAQIGRFSNAEDDLDAAMRLWQEIGHEPLLLVVRVAQADLVGRRGDPQEALRLADAAAATPLLASQGIHCADFHHALGELYRTYGRWEQALGHYQQALPVFRAQDQHKDVALTLARLATVATEWNKWDVAATYFSEAHSISARLAEAVSQTQARTALRADAENAAGIQALIRSDSPDRAHLVTARDFFRSAVSQVPENPWYQLNLAYASAELNEWVAASQAIEAVLECGEDWASSTVLRERLVDYRAHRAEDLHIAGRHREAAHEYAAVRTRVEKEIPVGRSLELLRKAADCLVEFGDSHAAEALYREGLERAQAAGESDHQATLSIRLALVAAANGDLVQTVNALTSATWLCSPGALDDLVREAGSLVVSADDYRVFGEAIRIVSSDAGLHQPKRRALVEAGLTLHSARYKGTHATNSLPVVTPLILEADDRLFPTGRETPQVGWMLDDGIPEMRSRIFNETGIWTPGVRIRGWTAAQPNTYRLLLNEVEQAAGTVYPDLLFCSEGDRCRSYGIHGESPSAGTFGAGGMWLSEMMSELARGHDLPLWDAYAYMLRHLEALIFTRLDLFIGIQEVDRLISEWRLRNDGQYRELVNTVVPDAGSVARLTLVLRGLARAGVLPKQLDRILPAVEQALAAPSRAASQRKLESNVG